jgi:hypothetical protein
MFQSSRRHQEVFRELNFPSTESSAKQGGQIFHAENSLAAARVKGFYCEIVAHGTQSRLLDRTKHQFRSLK